MTERLIVVTADPAKVEIIATIGAEIGVRDCYVYPARDGTPRQAVHLLVGQIGRQEVLDRLQTTLGGGGDWRITILPVEASIPLEEQEEAEPKDKKAKKTEGESREELYNDIARNARIDRNFIVFVVLSTLVAAIGLIEDSVAVVIGAMVIAPLLGPNLAFAFGVALGDRQLMVRAMAANALGVFITIGICFLLGLFWPVPLHSQELLDRTNPGLDGIAVALASGAAATMSLTAGFSSALVGVMVAVALMPPAAATGLLAGTGEPALALGAASLLAVNVVCINLAAQVSFVLHGVRPRTWFEKEAARRGVIVNAVVWLVLLIALAALLVIRSPSGYL